MEREWAKGQWNPRVIFSHKTHTYVNIKQKTMDVDRKFDKMAEKLKIYVKRMKGNQKKEKAKAWVSG